MPKTAFSFPFMEIFGKKATFFTFQNLPFHLGDFCVRRFSKARFKTDLGDFCVKKIAIISPPILSTSPA
ncbi:hypothetical protein CBW16_12170 [Flavobacteriaceae bacterium JJC]|nr:hypothetical protein CBW16_12170 [Flavobacteriaceae bacterium JJC]